VRLANVGGRLQLVIDGGIVDVERASHGAFDSDPQKGFDRFDEFQQWANGIECATETFVPELAGPPSATPKQIFAVGLNYREHADETGFDKPDLPVVFTKYVTSFEGPVTRVALPAGSVDWEVELVAVIGRTARAVPTSCGWDYVAGLTAGQDLSERELQRSGPAPQFGLAKSFPGFSAMGPVLVTPDEFEYRDNIALGCEVNGVVVQNARTNEMIYSVPALVSYLSGIVTLCPGDIIYTGTPPGVGMGRNPPWYLQNGDELRSWVEGIGELRQRFYA
jgi:2,4-diketo-3-deoxy-L-fuconate hydrolase